MIKEVHGAGGYGMLVGPAATSAEIAAFRDRIVAAPEKYIAQPTLALSTCPTFVEPPGSRRGISTCGPTCCRARISTWSRAD